jgi:hypothetical protein
MEAIGSSETSVANQRTTRRHIPEDDTLNIRIDFREIRWGGMDWIGLAQDRDQWRALVNTVMNLRGNS